MLRRSPSDERVIRWSRALRGARTGDPLVAAGWRSWASATSSADRRQLLAADEDSLCGPVERILPAIRDAARAHQVALAGPEATVWSGSSMGGLTALRGVGLYPQHVRAASVCSPSMWWTPDPAASPRDLLRPWNTGETDWITERLLRSGVDVDLRFSEGGHDHACWRAAWVDDLEALFAE